MTATTFWVDIEDASGNVLGAGPILPTRWRSTKRLDRAGDFSFEVPATDARSAGLVQAKRVARCYAIVNGTPTEIGAGFIESITVRASSGVPRLAVAGPDMLIELRRAAMVRELGTFNYSNRRDIPYHIVNQTTSRINTWVLKDEGGSTLGNGSNITTYAMYARFRDESSLGALSKFAAKAGEHFRHGPAQREITWIGPDSDFSSSGIRAVYNADPIAVRAYSHLAQIVDITHEKDSRNMLTLLAVRGSGEGEMRLDLGAATEWHDGVAISGGASHTRTIGGRDYTLFRPLNILEDVTASTAYGRHEGAFLAKDLGTINNTDPDLELAANELLRQAWFELQRRHIENEHYSLRLAGVPGVLLPGETIEVLAQRFVDGETPINIDATLNILAATIECDANGVRTTALDVSTTDHVMPSDADALVTAVEQTLVYQAHPQQGVSMPGWQMLSEIDPNYDADLFFIIDSDILRITKATLWFRVDPLRRFVVDALDPPATPVTHSHTLTTVLQSPVSFPMGFNAVGVLADTGGPRTFGTNTDGLHGHARFHGIEESADNDTYTDSQIDIKLNGTAVTNTPVDEGGGWFSLDLIDDIVDDKDTTQRPVQEQNTVNFADNLSSIAIASISITTGVVTCTTSTAHGFATGDHVWIEATANYNGMHPSIIVTGGTTFTFDMYTQGNPASETSGSVRQYLVARIQAQLYLRATCQTALLT